jgi:hypothetical protein
VLPSSLHSPLTHSLTHARAGACCLITNTCLYSACAHTGRCTSLSLSRREGGICARVQDRVLHTTTDLSVVEKNQMTFETFLRALPRLALERCPPPPPSRAEPGVASTRAPSRMLRRSKTSSDTARADSLMKLVGALRGMI